MAAVIVALLGAGAVVLDRLADAGAGPADPISLASSAPPAAAGYPAPDESPAPAESPTTKAPPVLSLPGDFPTEGPGEFRFADGEGEVLGEAGPLWRFRVAVEEGIDEDPDEVAEFIEETLGHRQGWTAGGDLRLQRVPGDGGYDFTVFLATSGTAAQLCAAGGLEIIGPGLPEGGVSCQSGGQVVLNFSRWRLSVPEYVDAEVPLADYRRMLVNHEVGHQLGHGHEGCPGEGEPAPVMQQQTIALNGCEPNSWPYLDGERYAGPPVAGV